MALTETLGDVQASDQVIRTPGGGSGFLGGLAAFGSQLAAASGRSAVVADQKETQATLNDAAQLVQTRFNLAQADLNPVEQQQLPADITQMADKLSKVQQSVKQGTSPASALNLRLESGIDELFRMHPEKKAVIAQYFNSMGLDHYVFRDVKAAYASAQNEIATQQAAENAAYEAGAKAGLFNPETTTRSQGIVLGQQFLQRSAEIDVGKKQLDMLKTKAEISDLDRKRIESEGNKNILGGLIGDADLRANQLTQALSALTIEALGDPSGQKHTMLKEALPQVVQGIETAKAQAITQAIKAGAGQETTKQISDYYDSLREGITRVHTGELSRDAQNQKILQNMQTQFGIEAAKAFPLWNQLSRLPGMANALPMLFSGNPAMQLSKEQQVAITKELSGWNPGSTDGLYHIQRVADVLRGDLKLANLSLPDAQKIIGTVNTAVVGNAQAINQGDKTAATAKPFLTGLEQLSDAAFTLSPGVDPKSQQRAAQILSDPQTGNALVALSKDPNHQAEAVQVVVSVRGTAQKGILLAKSGDWQRGTPGSLMKLEWDDKRQIVRQVLDEAAYKSYVANATAARAGQGTPGRSARQMDMDAQVVEVMSREQLLKRGDSTLATRADTINRYLDTMVRTMPADPTVPAGITPALARKAAFLGEPLDQAAKAGGKVDPFEQRLKALEQQALNLNSTTIANAAEDRGTEQNRARYEPVAHKAADKYGVPRQVASFLFGQEAGWNPAIGQTRIDNNGDGKPDSSARGIGQFIESTAKQYGLIDDKGNDFRGDANKSIDAAMRLLADNYRRTGSWEKALEAYGVTDRRNFKSEQAYNEVLNRARQAAQGD